MPREYKLYYFNGKAKGETPRMLFKLADQPFQDIRIEREDWNNGLKEKSPMGHVPYLEVDGKIMCQANAINRYLAEEFGFGGRTPLDKARTTMIADSVEDLFQAIKPVVRAADPEKKAAASKEFNEQTLLPFLPRLEKMLITNGGGDGYFVGQELTWADIVVVNMLNLYGLVAGNGDFWEDFPKLKALKARVESEPKIAQWIKDRPETPF